MHIVIENEIRFPEDARDTFAGYFASHGAPSDNVNDTVVEDTYIALIYRTVELVEQGLRDRGYHHSCGIEKLRPRAKVVCGVDEVVMKIEVDGLRVRVRVGCFGDLKVSVKRRGGRFGSANSSLDRDPGTSALDDVVDRALTSWERGAPDYNNHSGEQD